MLNMKIIYPSVDELPESRPMVPMVTELGSPQPDTDQARSDAPEAESDNGPQGNTDQSLLNQQQQVTFGIA